MGLEKQHPTLEDESHSQVGCGRLIKVSFYVRKQRIVTSRDERAKKNAAAIAEVRSQWLQEWSSLLDSNEEPLNTYRVIREIDRTLDRENSIVTHDAGAPRDCIVPFYTATTPHSYVGWGKTTHLGASILLMIGAKKAMPERTCVAFMGDGAFGMSGLDLETAVRADLPITVVLLNNGIMATYPGGTPVAREQFGVTHMTGDYGQIARGLGAGRKTRQSGWRF